MVRFGDIGRTSGHERRSATPGWGAWLISALLLTSCLYDSKHRCDPDQVFDESAGVCVCAGNTVPGSTGCIPCGDNEIAQGSACECADGYSRADAGACAPTPEALGKSCDPSGSDCTDAKYSTCHATAGGGYCTATGCKTNDDCTGGYACNTSANPSYCQRPPTGVGAKCTTSADCADYEATYCETLQSHTCQVQGCTVTPDDCFSGNQCCNLKSFGLPTLCVPAGSCPVK